MSASPPYPQMGPHAYNLRDAEKAAGWATGQHHDLCTPPEWCHAECTWQWHPASSVEQAWSDLSLALAPILDPTAPPQLDQLCVAYDDDYDTDPELPALLAEARRLGGRS